jgi:hypothetical protein
VIPRIRLTALVVLAVVVSGCSAPPGTKLVVDNGTTLAVTVVVNGQNIGMVAPQTQQSFDASGMPAMPWSIQVLSPSGRLLTSVSADPGSAGSSTDADGHTTQYGVGSRVDLSCGRLDVYVGPPMIGPAPGPGQPGDCEP